MAGYSVTYTVVDEATAKIEAINKRIQQLRAPLEHQQRALAKFIDASGLQKVADGFTSIAKSGLAAFTSLARVVPPLAAITGAASIAGMVKLVSEFGAWGDTLARDADQVNATATQLYAMQRALEAAGGDASTMTQGLKDLTQSMGAAATGQNARFAYRMQQAGIAMFDLNGHLRTADDVLPEILADINRSTNAFDRHTKAVDYGGEALATMAEDFRRSEKTLTEWRATVGASGLNLDEAARRAREYKQAIGELNDAFREVGVELATAFTPLIHEFATWVKENKPAIVAGTHQIAEGLKFVAENATTIAEIFAVAWGVRAVAGVAAVITQVVALNTVLAATGTAGALAAGVLGRFGIAGAAVAGIMAAIGLGRATGVVTGKGGPQWDPAWGPRPEGFAAPGPQPPDTVDRVLNPVRRFLGLPAKGAGAPTPPAAAPAAGAPTPPAAAPAAGAPAPPSAAGAPAEPAPPAPIAPISTAPAPTPAAAPRPVQLAGNRTPAPVRASGPLPPEARGLLDTIAGTESSGYDVLYGGRRFGDFSRHPGVNVPITRGPNAGKTSSAAGRYQFIKGTWADEQRRLGLPDFSPASQDVGAWDLAARTYRQKTGRDLQADLRAGRTGQIGPALHDQWTSLPGGIEQGTSESNFGRRLQSNIARQAAAAPPGRMPAATGAPMQITAGAGASGAVDVTITHKNPPPGARVRATGNGDVNVGAPRTEWQDMQSL